MKCEECKKWQESRNACFYAGGPPSFIGKILIKCFGCERFKPWISDNGSDE